jgi:hypothetical protein
MGKCTGLFTYSALAKGGSLLWYWVPESPAPRPLLIKYPLQQKENIECPLNNWYIIVLLQIPCGRFDLLDVSACLRHVFVRNVDRLLFTLMLTESCVSWICA